MIMNKNEVTNRVTATILSMSLLTVMAGAAIAPALGIIKAHFADAPEMMVQLIVSIPALLIIVTNLFFMSISRRLRTRTIAATGLMLYVVSGAGCFFADNIYVLLFLRAVLGISVGLIMPLLSAALYLGQFLSPIVVLPLSKTLFTDDVAATYKIGVMLCVAYLLQVYSTRHFQSLPPE